MNLITVKRLNPYSNEMGMMTLPISERALELYESGQLLASEAFPNLTPAQREFIISGITQEYWDKYHSGKPIAPTVQGISGV